jgi:hypothetical protein
MEKPNQEFNTGDYVKVNSGGQPLYTHIEEIVWDNLNNDWKYYFKDEDKVRWSEYKEAIEKA